MQHTKKTSLLGAGLLALSVLVTGCDGGGSGGSTQIPQELIQIDVSQASIVTTATKISGGAVTRTANDFSFPSVDTQNGNFSMTIPNSPPPEVAARRTVASSGGQKIGFGDTVILKYDMFSWAGGSLVESSSQFETAPAFEGGVSDNSVLPEYLAKSLLGRSIGDTVQVILPAGTEDLPTYLDSTDAHILVVELL